MEMPAAEMMVDEGSLLDTRPETCDRGGCPARALYQVEILHENGVGELVFCGHHFRAEGIEHLGVVTQIWEDN